MKTIEQKALAYDEAIRKAKDMLSYKEVRQEDIEYLFPELAESEDERIRKEIVRFIQMEVEDEIVGDKWIAWLKKQESVEEIVERCKKSWYNEGKIQGQIEGLTDEEKYQQGWHDALEKQGEPSDKGEISDGFHTFNELYYYRMLYNAAFFNMLPKEWVHKSKKHNDGEECFGGGWFIVMANLPTGQISNHYELKDWDLFQIPEKERADKWDGHTPQEAAERLHNFLLKKKGDLKPQGKSALEAWKEKKVDNRNKVEQKFKVGDWIVEPRKGEHNCIWHIERIEKNSYWEGHVGVFIEHADKYYHLWTIADAKDGDVLISKTKHPFIFKNYDEDTDYVYAYCGITDLVKDNGFYINYEDDELWTMYCVNGDVLPATKEQRDLLFQKMRKAGYEWDAEKKGLKLLITNGGDFEQENCEQNSAWSKEDDAYQSFAISAVEDYYDAKNSIQRGLIDWLKSLKDRVGCEVNCTTMWKPSGEQIDAFEHFVKSIGESGFAYPHNHNTKCVYSLLNDIKKL